MVSCNMISPQVFIVQEGAHERPILFTVSIIIDIGMSFERFVIIVTSLAVGSLPSSMGLLRVPRSGTSHAPLGSFGLLFTMSPVRALLQGGNRRSQDGPAAGRPALRMRSTRATDSDVRRPKARSLSRFRSRRPLPTPPARCRLTSTSRCSRDSGRPALRFLAEFATPAALYRACEKVRDAGFSRWDAHTPSPSTAWQGDGLGGRASLIVLVVALDGAAAASSCGRWIHTSAYPLVISGQPFFASATFIPVTSRSAVLLGALSAVFAMLRSEPLPIHDHPLFESQGLRAGERRHLLHLVDRRDPRSIRPRPRRC